jgi:hypothetical protein
MELLDLLSCDDLLEADCDFCFDLPLRLLAPGSSGASKRTAVWIATAAPPGGGGGLAPIASQLGQPGSAELDHWRARGDFNEAACLLCVSKRW